MGTIAALGVIVAIAVLVNWLGIGASAFSGHADVVDGDTLRIGSTRIRLVGIDAPELDQTCGASSEPSPCGADARRFLQSIVGSTIECRSDGHDRYGRALARCSSRGADLGASIVRAGWAVAELEYLADEAGARAAGRGIWAGPFVLPSEWRRSHGTEPAFWEWIRSWFFG